MKFIVSSAILQKHLSSISKVIVNNPVIPIIENFLFKINNGILTASATDLNIFMSSQLPIEADSNTSIAVPAKILIETLKGLPEQPVSFNIDEENNSIEITSHSGRYKITCEQAEDFPKMPVAESSKVESEFDIESGILSKALNMTLFAVGTDEMRPAMTGVFMSSDADSSIFVSTDGHRLVKYIRKDISFNNDTKQVIIPRKALTLLKDVLPSENSPLNVSFDKTYAHFSFDNVQMACRLIDEKYPDYDNAIPLENANIVTINRVDFLNALKRLTIYANKTTNQVRLKLGGTNLEITAEDFDFSNEAQENLLCQYEGDEMEIGFNVKFLAEILSNLTSTEINLHLSTPNRAGIIRPLDQEESEDILMLVMPVILNKYA